MGPVLPPNRFFCVSILETWNDDSWPLGNFQKLWFYCTPIICLISHSSYYLSDLSSLLTRFSCLIRRGRDPLHSWLSPSSIASPFSSPTTVPKPSDSSRLLQLSDPTLLLGSLSLYYLCVSYTSFYHLITGLPPPSFRVNLVRPKVFIPTSSLPPSVDSYSSEPPLVTKIFLSFYRCGWLRPLSNLFSDPPLTRVIVCFFVWSEYDHHVLHHEF